MPGKPAGDSHASIRSSRSRSLIALTNVKAVCCTLSFPVMPNSSFNTSRAKTRAYCERIVATHSKSRSHTIYRLSCGGFIHALAAKNVPALPFITRMPVRANLLTKFFICNTSFCSGQSITSEPNAMEPKRKTCSSRDRCKTFGY